MNKTFSKFLALGLAAISVFSLTACGGSPSPAPSTATAETKSEVPTASDELPAVDPESTKATDEAANADAATGGEKLAEIKERGKLILGCSADFPPYEFLDITTGKAQIAGFDITLAKEICKDMGVELEIKDMEFDGLLPAMSAGQLDIVISGMNADEERRKSVLFSDEYFYADQCVLIRKADEATYTTIESFSGHKVGAQTGSLQEGHVNDQFVPAGAEIYAIKNVPNLVLELKSERIDGLVLDKPIAEAFVRNNEDLVISAAPVKGDDSGFAVAMPLGEQALCDQINNTLKRLTDEGKMDPYFVEAVELAQKQEAK